MIGGMSSAADSEFQTDASSLDEVSRSSIAHRSVCNVGTLTFCPHIDHLQKAVIAIACAAMATPPAFPMDAETSTMPSSVAASRDPNWFAGNANFDQKVFNAGCFNIVIEDGQDVALGSRNLDAREHRKGCSIRGLADSVAPLSGVVIGYRYRVKSFVESRAYYICRSSGIPFLVHVHRRGCVHVEINLKPLCTTRKVPNVGWCRHILSLSVLNASMVIESPLSSRDLSPSKSIMRSGISAIQASVS